MKDKIHSLKSERDHWKSFLVELCLHDFKLLAFDIFLLVSAEWKLAFLFFLIESYLAKDFPRSS